MTTRNFVRYVRKKLGVPQLGLARYFGVRRETVGRWELGARIPSSTVLCLLLHADRLPNREARQLFLEELVSRRLQRLLRRAT